MALYFVNKSTHEGTLNEGLICAHKSHPLVATAWSSPTSILITDNEGESLTVIREPATGAPATNKTLSVTSLGWHPTERLLVIGWSNGKLSLWSMPQASDLGIEDKSVQSSSTFVNSAVQSIAAKAATLTDVEGAVREHNAGAAVVTEWTTHGSYLLSCSAQKMVSAWVLERTATGNAGKASEATVSVALKPLWSVEATKPMVQAIHVPSTLPAMTMQHAIQGTATTSAPGSPIDGVGRAADGTAAAVSETASPTPDDDELAFLLADGSSTVYSLTDEQKLTPCSSQKEDVVALLYEPKERLLVTMSSTQIVNVSRVDEDLSAALVLNRKLSTPSTSATGGKFLLSMVRAGSGVIAFGCGDDRIRILDVKTEAMYMVPFPTAGTRITHIASEVSRGMLAVGTAEGVVAVYVNVNSSSSRASAGPTSGRAGQAPTTLSTARTNESTNASVLSTVTPRDFSKDWEALATHELGECVDRVVLNPRGDIAVCTGSGAHLQILHETERMRAWDGTAAATQISTNMLVIESVTGCQCLLESQSKVRGLSIRFPNIALWSGTQIDVYTVNEATSTFSLVNFVPSTSPAFALHSEGLLYVKEGRITFATLQLQPISQLTFAESEGYPIAIDVMNDYMVAVSSKNYLRLARISSRDLRPLGPARPFVLHAQVENTQSSTASGGAADTLEAAPVKPASPEPSAAEAKGPIAITAARVNAQGRRVALMTKVGTLAVPDTHIWVYDADTDKISSYDFAARNEIPDALYWNTPDPSANSIGELEYLLLACETHQSLTGKNNSAQQQQQPEDAEGTPDANASATSVPGNSPSGTPARPTAQREDLPETLPDMESFAEAANGLAENRRGSLGTTNILANRTHNLVTLFATPRNGLAVHNTAPLKRYQICLVGLTIPDFLLSSVKINGDRANPSDYVIEQKRLVDFEGLKSDKDAAVREALMKFSYYSTMGNMDEAYRCIKTIQDPAAWQGLAQMCVANGRLDVAAVCLATMQDGVAARALREAKEEHPNEKNVQLAALACSLGMVDECERYLRLSKRYDLITEVYLACGKFEHAQRHAERHDRIHIRPVAYKYAHFMESLQNMDAAIVWYYNARCAGTDVPRVYFQTSRLHELHELMAAAAPPAAAPPGRDASADGQRSNGTPDDPRSTFATLFPTNRDLILWWARHSERRRDAPEALRFYGLVGDKYNTVRVLCGMSPPKMENAAEIVNEEVERAKGKLQQLQAADPSSAPTAPDSVGAGFFLGQFYERSGNAEKALQYYTQAGAYVSGVRVARRMERFNEVLSLSLASENERLMLSSAAFLESKDAFDKAVELYRKIGATRCALDGCVKGNLYETLHEISTSIAGSSSTDPEVFLDMAQHFQTVGDYKKAVEMLVFAKRYDEALQLCQDRSVTLTEDMAETMTGPNNTLPQAEKQELLLKLAHIAKDQGSWNLAGKKFTQAGERMKAMRMLMRGGDVDKVIFFANHSRNAEIYVLAGNFLQNQNWATDANVLKSIVQFYTKAKAYESLGTFYDSCAQFYIDENRNYKDAVRVTEECLKTLEKASGVKDSGVNLAKVELVREKLELLRTVVKAQQVVDTITPDDPEKKKKSDEVINICSDFIKRSRPSHEDHELIDSTVRIGDIFALLVKFYFERLNEPKNAFKVLQSMPKHDVEPKFFVESDTIEKVCQANGKTIADIGSVSVAAAPEPDGRRRSSEAAVNEDDEVADATAAPA